MILFWFGCIGGSQNSWLSPSQFQREYAQQQLESPPLAEDINPDPNVVEIELTAAPMQHEILDWRSEEAIVVDGYAYNGSLPAPTIRTKIGDTVIVHLINHWTPPPPSTGMGSMCPMTWMAPARAATGSTRRLIHLSVYRGPSRHCLVPPPF